MLLVIIGLLIITVNELAMIRRAQHELDFVARMLSVVGLLAVVGGVVKEFVA